jgi:CHAT domain-containing protein
MRLDISMLGEQHAELAKEFASLRDKLDSPVSEQDSLAPTDNTPHWMSQSNRIRAQQQFEDVITRIRALPGFENFLLPPTSDELMEAAAPGPIIVINLSPYRCDAFLIERHQIRALRLPNLDQRDVEGKLQDLRSTRTLGASTLTPLLEWLWHAIAFPCLQALGLKQPLPDGPWPRVWWVPTGALSHFPLHAAGLHRKTSTETVLDRVVSSYSPSVKSLLYVRRTTENWSPSSSSGKVLLVSMPSTPKQLDLKFAEEEVKVLDRLLPASVPRVKLNQAYKKEVLSCLTTASVFHFAGHGKSDPNDPSKSCLLPSDWESNPLTVEDLMSLNLHHRKPWLAYLSACSTGESQHMRLFDESLHLVNACQLAGFQHVVGSLWEVSDMHCVDAARIVYETVKGDFGTSNEVAWGVHKAARFLRGETSPGGRRQGSEEGGLEGTLLEEGANGLEDELTWSREDASGKGGKDAEPRNGDRDAKIIKTKGGRENDEIGNPLIWAAYIHVGP